MFNWWIEYPCSIHLSVLVLSSGFRGPLPIALPFITPPSAVTKVMPPCLLLLSSLITAH